MTTAPPLPEGFLWGASTSPHQTEGGNVHSDWWFLENDPNSFVSERSGDATDSYNRYPEDMRLLADAGLTAYRFGIEWARIEPAPGEFMQVELDHYRRMIETAQGLGLTPVVTLHHFTSPAWFAQQGGWLHPDAVDLFARYVEQAATILHDVQWVCTINEPNIIAAMAALMRNMADNSQNTQTDTAVTSLSLPTPDSEIAEILTRAHKRAVGIVHANTPAKAGWTIAGQQLEPTPGNKEIFERTRWEWEDRFLEVARGDDFVGIQAYTSQTVDADGIVAHPAHPDNTLSGWAYRPDALEMALRHAWDITGGTPLLVTENGISTDDDDVRIRYTEAALAGLDNAVSDGLDVRGYLHWSALDNYEWGHWGPTFGLIAVDRTTFERHPKPSLGWLGQHARTGIAQVTS
ncbi:glycoside hydrolase family 1 protein [Paenarthrobacter nitroguajacolicus]|uniref:Glycoside hydrolase family 1 protein n=1 Tax=Paenarthrobacter nitroguajacolicus TaxID=211146 RepID=A0A558GNK9_PAENT|nr:family 1 glycosylhydrolase [Paenarthrobacter nitroguajacolicus]TVU58469.1 glycoside hydrolase family 1 protein [Paenarthrobacter nitroguajacolicus]